MPPNYYRCFRFLTRRRRWLTYLEWAYTSSRADLAEIGREPAATAAEATLLLCGTGGAVTSWAFVSYVQRHTPAARIVILDQSPIPLAESRTHLEATWPEATVSLVQADARRPPFREGGFDQIETDGFFEFFPASHLPTLLHAWRRILKEDGVVTMRAYARQSIWGLPFDGLRWLLLWGCVGFKLHLHSYPTLEAALAQSGFRWLSPGGTGVPNLRRFVMWKM